MHLTRYGLREWLTITVIAAACGIGVALVAAWWALIPLFLLWLALVAFFRDPWRRIPVDLPAGSMLSPADGTVSKLLRVDHHEAVGGPAQIIRVFLSVLDVHIDRAPADVEVLSLKHVPGRYLDARTEESARVNESNLILLRMGDGERIGVRQVSGAIARRIVCPLRPGDRLERGQRFGMIKFGSTTELILPRPDDVEVLVREGDRVVGGLTVVARLREASA